MLRSFLTLLVRILAFTVQTWLIPKENYIYNAQINKINDQADLFEFKKPTIHGSTFWTEEAMLHEQQRKLWTSGKTPAHDITDQDFIIETDLSLNESIYGTKLIKFLKEKAKDWMKNDSSYPTEQQIRDMKMEDLL